MKTKRTAGNAKVQSKSPARRRPARTAPESGRPASVRSVTRLDLGARVRQIRQENSWTLQELSRRTGVNVSSLSKLENGLIDVTFETVMKICSGLDLSLEHLTNHEQATFRSGIRSVTRRNEGLQLATQGYGFEVLCTDIARKGLLPVIVTVKARSLADVPRKSQHSGEEFIYVIRGRIHLYTEFYEPTLLKEGDSAYYDSSGEHAFVNAGDGEALVLSVSRESSGMYREVTGHLDRELG
jgi:transcriptional regulator with XRE-family HTH domain